MKDSEIPLLIPIKRIMEIIKAGVAKPSEFERWNKRMLKQKKDRCGKGE